MEQVVAWEKKIVLEEKILEEGRAACGQIVQRGHGIYVREGVQDLARQREVSLT